jgi:prefoldin subunit 5
MQDRMKTRLAELKAEFAKGKQQLDDLENQTREVQHALLRISGAIQVLEELSGDNAPPKDSFPRVVESAPRAAEGA